MTDARMAPRDRPARAVPAALWLLPIVLWTIATAFLGFDLGRWADDYAFTLLDAGTGTYERLLLPPIFGRTFWRPLHGALLYDLGTLLWFRPWLAHLLSAVVHGVVCILLFRLLRRIGCSLVASALATLLFLTAPVHYEVVLWPSAISAGIATALVLAMAAAFVRHVQRGRSRSSLALLAVTGFAVPCFYEQPAGLLAGLPLLGLAVLPTGSARSAAVRRIVGATIASWIGPALYLVLFRATATASFRGAAGTIVALHDVTSRVTTVAHELAHALAPSELLAGAVVAGAATVAAFPVRAAVLIAVLAAAVLPWLSALREPSMWTSSDTTQRTAATVLFAAVAFAGSLLPIVVVPGQNVPPRVTYAPLVALSMLAATTIDVLASRRHGARARLVRTGCVAVASAAMVAGTLLAIGMQARFAHRARADERLARELMRAVPDPPQGTMLLVLSDDAIDDITGYAAYDHALPGPLTFPFSAPNFVRFAYRRSDLLATGRAPYAALLTRGGDALAANVVDAGLTPNDFARTSDGLFRVPWSRLVPIVVQGDGTIRVVTTLIVPDPEGHTIRVTPHAADAAARHTGAPALEMALP